MPSARQTMREPTRHGLKEHQAEPHPAGGELVQIETLAVKQMQEAVICLAAKVQNTDIAGNTGLIGPATEPIRVRTIHRKVRDLRHAGRRDRTACIQANHRIMDR